MHLRVRARNNHSPVPVVLRCPRCRQVGTFEPIQSHDSAIDSGTGEPTVVAGERRCPDPDCHEHVFFFKQRDKLLATYPPERLDFDASDVPEPVRTALEEA